ncbi:MAG: hypothetical protein ACI92E_003187, partial [Oceanicoccus sp.]
KIVINCLKPAVFSGCKLGDFKECLSKDILA